MNNGKQLEELLKTTHHEYLITRKADIQKVPETWGFTSERDFNNLSTKAPMMAGKTSAGKSLAMKKSDVDFIGTIAPNGRAIKFDAKNVKEAVSIPLTRFTKHQVESGLRCQAMGGIGGFIVYFESQKRAFWIDAKKVRELQDKALFNKGTKSINLKDFEKEIRVENRKIDWLKITEKI